MAISILQQPQAYQPAYNNQWFMASSNQLAQPNFKYRVIVTDLISSTTLTYDFDPRPDTRCVFDAGVFSENQIRTSNYIPVNTYGWQLATGIRKIRVNIGEYYGATPTYHAGSNIDYIIWNGMVQFLDFPSYDMDNFVYDSSFNFKYFAGVVNDTTFTDRSNYLYVLTSQAGDLSALKIITYTSAGAVIGTSFIPNPFVASTNYQQKYLCIDVGHKGLLNIPIGLTTGFYPIISAATAYYEIYDDTNGGLIKTITIGCSPRFEVLTVHYLADNGAFLSVNFEKVWEKNHDKTVSSYSQNPNDIDPVSGLYGYDYGVSVDKQLSVSRQTKLSLKTDWLSDAQIAQYRECYDSPVCFLDRGSSLGYASIKSITNSYRDIPHYADKLVRLEMDFNFTHQNFRQRT